MRRKPLEQLNNLFKDLVLILEEKGFKFNYLINNKLVDNGSYKGKILEQVFFFINT